jgi:preprotein translocase subunit SecA
MDRIGLEEDMPLEAKMISSTVENSQRKIEGRNFSTRKSVLNFDDVMNNMRTSIYGQRREVLAGEDVSDRVKAMVHDSISANVDMFLVGDLPEDWDWNSLRSHYLGWLTNKDDYKFTNAQRADELYAQREEKYGAPLMREVERVVLLRAVDTLWMDHIDNMEELRQGIYLRSYGQRDPVVEYRIEGFEMYDAMIEQIKDDVTRMMLTVQIGGAAPEREQVAKPTAASGASDGTLQQQPVKNTKKVGRRIQDFFYFNDFYIFALAFIILLGYLVYRGL